MNYAITFEGNLHKDFSFYYPYFLAPRSLVPEIYAFALKQ